MTGTTAAREVRLGPVTCIPPGEGKAFQLGQEAVAVFRLRDGSLYAVQSRCPHEQGPLAEGVTGGCTVICPLHAWKFDLSSGACLTDPAQSLRTYPVREEGGELILTVG